MACLGVHFAITADVADRLTRDRPPSNTDVVAWLEDLDRQFHALDAKGWVEMTDKAWDGIHRSLTDGKLEPGNTRATCASSGRLTASGSGARTGSWSTSSTSLTPATFGALPTPSGESTGPNCCGGRKGSTRTPSTRSACRRKTSRPHGTASAACGRSSSGQLLRGVGSSSESISKQAEPCVAADPPAKQGGQLSAVARRQAVPKGEVT